MLLLSFVGKARSPRAVTHRIVGLGPCLPCSYWDCSYQSHLLTICPLITVSSINIIHNASRLNISIRNILYTALMVITVEQSVSQVLCCPNYYIQLT